MSHLEQYLDRHHDRFEQELCELVRLPSVSADRQYQAGIRAAAEWVAGQFRRLRLTTELIATSGHPLVYAESPPVPGAPTVLVYGHYDVQPADPLSEWTTPPFEPRCGTATCTPAGPRTTRARC